MRFTNGQIINATNAGRAGSTRWRVTATQYTKRIAMAKVEDIKVSSPLSREFVAMTLDLSNDNHGYKPLDILDYKKHFIHACECVSGNFSGLPEPIDYFTIENNDPGIPYDEKKEMPFIVCHYSDTTPVYARPTWINNENQMFNHLKKLAYSVGFTARTLHEQRIALRQVTLENLRFLRTMKSYIIAEFFGLCSFDENAKQYDPHRPHLVLDPLYAAPECFSTARLTPAVDVYALAILLLQFMGAKIKKPIKDENDVLLILEEVEKIQRYAMRESAVRALKLALRSDPGQRPYEFNEFINIFNDRPLQKKPYHNNKNRGRRF